MEKPTEELATLKLCQMENKVIFMMAIGRKDISTGKAWKRGLMGQGIKENFRWIRNMERVDGIWLMDLATLVNLRMDISKVMELIKQKMVLFTKDLGSKTRWKDMANSNGKRVKNMKDISNKINFMVRVNTHGETVRCISEAGMKVNNTGKDK